MDIDGESDRGADSENDEEVDGEGGSDRDADGGNDGGADNELRNGLESDYSHQYLNNDALENIIKITVQAFPFMRTSLRAVNTFFKATVDKMPCPTIYLPKLGGNVILISVQKLLKLRRKGSSVAVRLREVINSSNWYRAWVRLVPLSFGWFGISGIFWRSSIKYHP